MKLNLKKPEKPTGHQVYEFFYQVFIVLIGSFLFAVSLNMFLLPAGIVVGGVTGISTILNILFGTPVGLMIILINLPLIIVNGFIFGFRFLMKTCIGLVITSVFCDVITFLPVTVDDPLLCAILGGVTMGAGMGLLFSRGFTTGGTDLIATLLKKKFTNVPTGKLVLIVDFVVIVGSAVILQRYQGIIYSLVATYSSSFILDLVLGGTARARLAIIISDHPDVIADDIMKLLGRGVTSLSGKGCYTQKEKNVLLCVVKPAELYRVKQIIKKEDPAAFIIFADASEVVGDGFHSDSLM